MAKTAFPHTVRALSALHGAVHKHHTLPIHSLMCWVARVEYATPVWGYQPHFSAIHCFRPAASLPSTPAFILALPATVPQMHLSILHMFFPPKPSRQGPCTPIPMMAVSTWHPRAGLGQGSLFGCPFSPLFLNGRQLLNTTNPPPLYPPNTSGQEATV